MTQTSKAALAGPEIVAELLDAGCIAAIDIGEGAVRSRERDAVCPTSDCSPALSKQLGGSDVATMTLHRVGGVALGIRVDQQHATAGLGEVPGEVDSERRLADAALLVVDHDGLHGERDRRWSRQFRSERVLAGDRGDDVTMWFKPHR